MRLTFFTIIICMRSFENILREFLRIPLGTIKLFTVVLFKNYFFINVNLTRYPTKDGKKILKKILLF